jgi:transposase
MTVQSTRSQHGSDFLRQHATRVAEARVARRLLTLALVLKGHDRAEAIKNCSMDSQTLRDWVIRHTELALAGLSGHQHGGGAASKLSAEEKRQLAVWVCQTPNLAEDGVVRWRCATCGSGSRRASS